VTVFGQVKSEKSTIVRIILGITKPSKLIQLSILRGSVNRVPAIGWGNGGNVISARWQLTVWSHNGKLVLVVVKIV